MTVFTQIKESVTVPQAAERYGLETNRSRMCRCPFHADRSPSMKLNDQYFYCFGCQESGDVIALCAKLFDLSPMEAARKLADDFGIRVDEPADPKGKPHGKGSGTAAVPSGPFRHDASALASRLNALLEKDRQENLRAWSDRARDTLGRYLLLLREWKDCYAPSPGDAEWHPRYAEAVHNETWLFFLLEQADERDPVACAHFYQTFKEEIKRIDERINLYRKNADEQSIA